jgi:hypothetical protein
LFEKDGLSLINLDDVGGDDGATSVDVSQYSRKDQSNEDEEEETAARGIDDLNLSDSD